MKSITSDDILGKTAVDPNGSLLGTVVKLHIDNNNKTIQGITVDQGFMRPDLFVGIEHVRRFGIDAVLLSSIPYDRLKGKRVLSAKGVILGTVAKVVTDGPDLKTLVLSKKTRAFKREESEVNAREVKEIGQTIILRKRSDFGEEST